MRILITGALGMLGQAVVREANRQDLTAIPADLNEFDICDPAATRAFLTEAAPEAVVHCAAYTAVDKAEEEPDRAMSVNEAGTRNVAEACSKLGASFLYVSTDYVFDGCSDKPYLPEAERNPLGVYGKSKAAGEIATIETGGEWIIARSSWLFGGGGKNFVDTMISAAGSRSELRVVDDQVGRPTFTGDLAKILLTLTRLRSRGIFHAANEGTATWFELAAEALRLRGISSRVIPILSKDWPTPAPRPAYSVLDLEKTSSQLDFPIRSWREALEQYLR